MPDDDHLTLRLVRLNEGKKWQPAAAGLCFVFVRGGTGKYVADATNQRLGLGDVLVFDGQAGGRIGAADAGELSFSCFSASIEQMLPLFSVNEISLLKDVFESFKGIKLHPAGTPVAAECHRLVTDAPPQFNLDHRIHLLRVMAVILNEEFKSLQMQRRGIGFVTIEQHLLAVFEKLTANDLLSLSVSELAGKFGCSRRHLNRLYHQYFGFSIAALRMEMRMLKAISLLRESDEKIINIAAKCGFNHLGLFNICFKKRFGASPGQWRLRAAQAPAGTKASTGEQPPCPLESNGLCPRLGGLANTGVDRLRNYELRNAVLSAVLTKPAERKTPGQSGSTPPPRLNGHPDTSGRSLFQANA